MVKYIYKLGVRHCITSRLNILIYSWTCVCACMYLIASTHCSVPLSTNCVAFLLLKKFRKEGVFLSKLFSEVQQLKLWFSSYGKDVGFTGDVEKTVLHAVCYNFHYINGKHLIYLNI